MTLVGRTDTLPTPHTPGPKCMMGRLYDRLRTEGQDNEAAGLLELVEAVRNERQARPFTTKHHWTGASLHRVLIEEGYEISLLTVQRHVARSCACGW
jgi:hypothetical protein